MSTSSFSDLPTSHRGRRLQPPKAGFLTRVRFQPVLGKLSPPKTDEFLEKFRRGGGVISNPKIYVADFGHYEGSTSVMNFGENPQHDFPKMRGGSMAVWNFSENSSVLGGLSFPKSNIW